MTTTRRRTLRLVDETVAWAPGKINVVLRVGPLQDDGYHHLVSVFQGVSLGERVTARRAAGFSVTVAGRDADRVPLDDSNLALRAARAVAEIGQVEGGVHLHIDKQIPVAGGMAGGSADAAATLVACDALWGLGLTRGALHRIGARLGSDVPFCLTGGTAVGTGRGERLAPVLEHGSYWWVAAISHRGLATPEVFRQFDLMYPPPLDVGDLGDDLPGRELDAAALSRGVLWALAARTPAALAEAMVNSLEGAALALRPELASVKWEMGEYGALATLVSGSGPTVIGLAESEDDAREIAELMTSVPHVDDAVVFSSPAPGAHLL